jgi:hypothetical protein
MKISKWQGGNVHKISDSIIHLMRGQIFDINGISIFTFGGAKSHDRGRTTEEKDAERGKIWWDAEMPTFQEMDEARDNLANHNWKVDYIITHDLPEKELITLGMKQKRFFQSTFLNSFLEDIRIQTEFKHWYSGHYHEDITLSYKQTVLYHEILELGELL